jgi:hypothetical protein
MKRPFVIVHPCDAERARPIATALHATLLTADNWPADSVGFDGIRMGYATGLVRQHMPGWDIRFLSPRTQGA